MHIKTRILVILITLTSFCTHSGCSRHSALYQGTARPWAERQSQLLAIKNWEIQGKMAFRGPQDGGQMSFDWIQQASHFQLHLYGPFGSGSIKLLGSLHELTIQKPDGSLLSHSDPQVLLRQELKLSLPLVELPYWIRGIAAPHKAVNNLKLDPQNRLQSLEQSGWKIDYLSYKLYGKHELPYKLILKNKQLTLKYVLQQWKLQ
jgi:outer membrane lipoprotein LolB